MVTTDRVKYILKAMKKTIEIIPTFGQQNQLNIGLLEPLAYI